MSASTSHPSPENVPLPRASLAEFFREFIHDARNAAFPLQVQLHLMASSGSGSSELADVFASFLTQHRQLLSVLERVSEVICGESTFHPATVDLGAVVRMAARAVEPRVAQKQQRLEIDLPDDPIFVRGDVELLGRAFGELLDNAVRYTPVEGEILVRASVSDDTVRVVVRDTGPGFEASLRDHAFEPFQCAPSMRPIEGRAGIGLSLVQRIIGLHQGGAHLGRSAEPGAEVILVLPTMKAGASHFRGPDSDGVDVSE